MTEKRFTREDIVCLNEILHEQFINYYRMNNDDMTWSEKLFFNHIQKMVEEGFNFKIS